MSARYSCKLPLRKQAVLDHDTLNGIDYIEVGDRDDGGTHIAQARLALSFVKPVAPAQFGPDNIRVEGGEPVRRIRVAAVSWPGASADARIVEIDLEDHGDFSSYTLRIVQGPGNPQAPSWLDPVLGAIEFSFKAACPSDFDCAPSVQCLEPAAVEPDIDYLAKDYASFRQLMLDRMSTIMPGWSERNPSDLGIAAVEVLAYAADQLSYYQDAVATEAYLGTARRRVSVRRHARLLDYPMHDGCNARTWICLTASAEAAGEVLPAHTPLLTGDSVPDTLQVKLERTPIPGAGPGAESAHVRVDGVPEDRQVFETMHDLTLHPEHNRIEFYTWGDDDCCLPQGATTASLRNVDNGLATLGPGDLLLFEEVADARGSAADADRHHRHVVRLTAAKMVKDPLFDESVLDIEWAAADALPFALCLWRRSAVDGGDVAPVSVARGNMVLADHGRTIWDEPLVPDVVPATLRYRPHLDRSGVTQAEPFDAERAGRAPAAATLSQEPRAALAAVSLRENGEVWTVRRDLLGSDRFSEDFVVETEADGRAQLRFGDGVLGRRPAAGAQLRATYRIGNGSAGNVGADTLKIIIPADERLRAAGLSISNPLPASGGTEPEAIEHVRLYAPQAFRIQRRAVVPSDYAALAQTHPEVQKAVATQRWTGSWHTVFVTVDRRGGRQVDAEFEDELRAFLEPYRIMGHDLEIEAPRMVPLDIALTVCVQADHLRSAVKAALLDAFSSRARPDGTTGFFHPDRLTFGQSVFLSAVVSTAMQVHGVTWVAAERFQRQGEPDRGELSKGRIDVGHLEIARLDNDPNAPAHGRMELIMQGGL